MLQVMRLERVKKLVIKSCQLAAILAVYLFSTSVFSEQYRSLKHPVSDAPEVVEFFSFYCGPCYQLTDKYPVVSGITRLLPAGHVVTRYHVSALGKLGHELSEAWAVATMTGVADRVEGPLFKGVQCDKSVKSMDDILALFRDAGITPEEYNSALHSMVV